MTRARARGHRRNRMTLSPIGINYYKSVLIIADYSVTTRMPFRRRQQQQIVHPPHSPPLPNIAAVFLPSTRHAAMDSLLIIVGVLALLTVAVKGNVLQTLW